MTKPIHAGCACPGSVPAPRTRREFLQTASNGFGLLALSALMADRSYAGLSVPLPAPHRAPRVKNVIFCFMDGGPSQVDTFDPKPALTKYQGQKIGDRAVSKLSQSTAERVWLGSPWAFRQPGRGGLW